MDEPAARGADLARIMLRQAMESARSRGATTAKPKRSVRRGRGDGRDPVAFGAVMQRLLVDNGWQQAADGGTLITRWPAIVGEDHAQHWKAVHFDETTGTLTVLCDSDSWARMLSLVSRQLIAEANEKVPAAKLHNIQVRKDLRRAAPSAGMTPADPSPACPTRARLPGSNPSPSYVGVRDQLRTAKAARDAAVVVPELPDERGPVRIQGDPDDHTEARYYREALEEEAARSTDVYRRALLRARQEREKSKTSPTAIHRASSAV
ncbi:DciA family protein [Streptomyces sp. NPDC056084]|uniref:DciA family protein n=1 Tax=unclassified Streptomyces TaxID=2593676 RepID=UPI0035D9440D